MHQLRIIKILSNKTQYFKLKVVYICPSVQSSLCMSSIIGNQKRLVNYMYSVSNVDRSLFRSKLFQKNHEYVQS